MEFVLRKNTDVSGNKFIAWLNYFKALQPSLLIEIDPAVEKFIAKSFPLEKNVVKHAEISFEDAGFEMISSKPDLSDGESNRIMVGIYKILPKFIDMIKLFNDRQEYDIVINYDVADILYLGAPANAAVKEMLASSWSFKSSKLNVNVTLASLTDSFMSMPDQKFNNVLASTTNNATFTLSSKEFTQISKLSVLSSNLAQAVVRFKNTRSAAGTWELIISDDEHTYEMNLDIVEASGNNQEFEFRLYRDHLLNTLAALPGDQFTLNVSSSYNAVSFVSGNYTTLVATVK